MMLALRVFFLLAAATFRESRAFSPTQFFEGAKGLQSTSPYSRRNAFSRVKICYQHSMLSSSTDKVSATESAVTGACTQERVVFDEKNMKLSNSYYLMEYCKSMLDRNNDGKIDADDLKILRKEFEALLDVNGDGKVDMKDAQAALSIFIVSSALVASPDAAVAKGGGHGGGHGGSHSHSHGGSRNGRRVSSSGGSYYSHSSNDDEEDLYAKFKRRDHHDNAPLDLSPNSCVSVPDDGEEIDILSVGVDGRVDGTYVPATVSRRTQGVGVDDNFWECRFVATPTDSSQHPVTLSSPKNIQSYALYTFLLGYIALIIMPWELGLSFSSAQEVKPLEPFVVKPFSLKKSQFDEIFNNALVSSQEDGVSAPTSGTYSGWSEEWNGHENIRQEVQTQFIFKDNGTIIGSGEDSIDGKYVVSGEWRGWEGKYLLCWTETYDRYSVEAQCKMEIPKVNPKMKGYYRSTQDIEGKFELFCSAGER